MKKNYNDYAVDELVAQYKQDKNERVFTEIMEKTKGLICVFARSYSRSIIGAEMEDLISEGNLILWDAVRTFDDTRDCRFTTYLCGCLKRNYNTLFSMCNCKKRNPGCFVQSYEQINSNSEYEEDGNRLGNSEFSVECGDYSMIEMKMLLDRLELSENERVKRYIREGKLKPEKISESGEKLFSNLDVMELYRKKKGCQPVCSEEEDKEAIYTFIEEHPECIPIFKKAIDGLLQ